MIVNPVRYGGAEKEYTITAEKFSSAPACAKAGEIVSFSYTYGVGSSSTVKSIVCGEDAKSVPFTTNSSSSGLIQRIICTFVMPAADVTINA